MEPTPTQIVIEVERHVAPISGHEHADGALPRAFIGWTGLFAALRDMAGEDRVQCTS